MTSVTIKEVIEGLRLELLAGHDGVSRKVFNPALVKPGIELAGMLEFYENDRIQIMGSKEAAFFHSLEPELQEERIKALFEKDAPAFIFTKNVDVPEVFIHYGDIYNIPILKSFYKTTSLVSELYSFLQAALAERTTMHGVLLDINGVGVLMTGKSGLGKSEVALELIRRGYILVADDTVEIYQVEKGILVGEAPKVLKKYLEIRGVGVVNVVYLYGVKSYREKKRISLIVELQKWDDDNQNYDRLGLKADRRKIFDTYVSYAALPITEARNAATLVEAAAFDYKSKNLGYNSAEEFNKKLNEYIKLNQENDNEED
ncbi:MAG: HPr(Ser) kinase/phosphatase [Tenericutes bacterium HGW-Tenericutes-5]|jgi:HPr kinase/phosphorylase|nr:MAG: HPr(Ser) kinase/phosphatase [Tenericutes bacterium HGW-Tenericutes-5]